MPLEYFCCYNSYLKACKSLSDGEVGRLFRALMIYNEHGTLTELNGREAIAFDFIAASIDRDHERYDAKCEQNKANVSKRYERMQSNTAVYDGYQEKDKEKDKDKEKESKAPTRHKHGEYGWVKLTDAEYQRLIAELGETETARCIAYVDQSAQQTGNKNKWKDWNLTVRKCHRDGWGRSKMSEREAFLNG